MDDHGMIVPKSPTDKTTQPARGHDPERLLLGNRDVHIWQLSLDQSAATMNHLRQLLAADEEERARRFHFEVDRRHFIAGRGCLRMILSRYLKTSPEKIEFTYTDYGKPQVAASGEPEQLLNFNLAHSRGVALYAFTRLGQIGVDIEYIRPEFPDREIARRFFSASEVARLENLPVETRPQAFFNCWTRKEAFIKAKGVGLSMPLDQFDVNLDPAEPAALLRTTWDENEAAQWSLRAIETAPGYAAAVAVRAHDWQLSFRRVEEESLLSFA
jgi:4'-phosphopantetheinyl transferase